MTQMSERVSLVRNCFVRSTNLRILAPGQVGVNEILPVFWIFMATTDLVVIDFLLVVITGRDGATRSFGTRSTARSRRIATNRAGIYAGPACSQTLSASEGKTMRLRWDGVAARYSSFPSLALRVHLTETLMKGVKKARRQELAGGQQVAPGH
jgi:hypothetical protein